MKIHCIRRETFQIRSQIIFFMVDDSYNATVVLDKNLSIIEDNIVYAPYRFDKYIV